jgi:hypothetical protein
MLKRYSDLRSDPSRVKQSLLLGNGFSISIKQSFSYPSLFEKYRELVEDPFNHVAGEVGREVYHEEDLLLFEKLDTRNFETVLKFLRDSGQLGEQYGRIQNALIKTILIVHPQYKSEIVVPPMRKIAELFRRFSNIFTTNYDLIPYWVMAEDFSLFGDLFVRDTFRPHMLHYPNDRSIVFYLHGALHLFGDRDGAIRKVKRSEQKSVYEILTSMTDKGDHPLFVSEGESIQKLAAIKSSEYLSFSLDTLAKLDGSLTVMGHSLSENDQHIIDAINDSSIKLLLIGVHGGQGNPEEISCKFPEKVVECFDTTDFWSEPLFNPWKRNILVTRPLQ